MASSNTLSRTLSSPKELSVVDPSPEDDFSPSASKDSYFPSSSSPESTSTPSKWPSLPSYPRTLTLLQRYSSYTFTVFAAMHLTSTGIAPLIAGSSAAANSYLLLFRPYYQSWPLAEPAIVLAPLALHIGSGILLRAHRAAVLKRHYGFRDAVPSSAKNPSTNAAAKGKQPAAPVPPVSLTSATGFASAILVSGHALLNRALPVYVAGSSSGIGLDFAGHGAARAPHWLVGYAGFALLVGVAGAHMVSGWAKWLSLAPPAAPSGASAAGESAERKLMRKRRTWGVVVVTALVVGVWIAGGVGVVVAEGRVPGWVGEEYDRIFEGVPYIGKYL